MRTPLIFRFLFVQWVLFRYGFERVLFSAPWLKSLFFLRFANPWNWVANRRLSNGQRLRLILTRLGPIYVKLGQVLSTRRDLFSADLVDELAMLQDAVPPFSGKKALQILEGLYQKPLNAVFQDIEETPLAAASIAQVHAATLKNGQAVIVKLLRPGIKRVIQRDIALMYKLARFIARHFKGSERFHPVEIVAEFEATIMKELDLQREAANAAQLRRNFDGSDLLYVPEVYWDFTQRQVMVQERIQGIPVDDVATLQAAGISLKALAERGVEIFFTQVFRDSFFHADMHPGNIFVSPKYTEKPLYMGVDFGIMGTLTPFDQRYLAENMLAFFKRDYKRVATLHIESGWVAAETRVDEFEAAIRTVCEPIFQKPLSEISFAQLLLRLFQIAKSFQMDIQPQLLLLQKTLFNIEGLGRQLYPDLDLWATAKPLLERFVRKQFGPRAFFRKVRANLPMWIEKAPDLPSLVYQVLQEAQPMPQKPVMPTSPPAPVRTSSRLGLVLIVAAGTSLLIHNAAVHISTSATLSLGAIGAALWLFG
ncbi:MAG: putative protein kinase UbiB [marine bacterium B5-7]|nr:MAG: putative protein kinase UbiB [marine bacterium B5-7]